MVRLLFVVSAVGAGRGLTACVAVARAFSSARSEEALAIKEAVEVAFEESPECEDVNATALVWQTTWERARLFESAGKAYAGEGAGQYLVQQRSYSASATKEAEIPAHRSLLRCCRAGQS